eukprot:55330-Chlamydomonas_euryale.AAC.1
MSYKLLADDQHLCAIRVCGTGVPRCAVQTGSFGGCTAGRQMSGVRNSGWPADLLDAWCSANGWRAGLAGWLAGRSGWLADRTGR